MSNTIKALFIIAVAATTGCASIVSGTNQPLSVETKDESGSSIVGATCTLSNPKGSWFVTTPGSVTVSRAFDPLLITCKKGDEMAGSFSALSSTKPMAFGNILFGGIIGAGVDIATGAAYDYPSVIVVPLKRNK